MSANATAGGKSPLKRARQSTSTQPIKRRASDHGNTPASEPGVMSRLTLYDAIAGRVGRDGLILDTKQKPIPPDQALFGRADAPIRYEETDTYFAHRQLPPHVKLPESDLLKDLHAYVSDFYGSGTLGDCELDWASMDETALLAMGILLEESVGAKLGKTGDLAFVEGEKVEKAEAERDETKSWLDV